MFGRYTERAQRLIIQAMDRARDLKFDYVGTEHLLLALVEDGESLATKALEFLGADRDQLRAELLRMIGQGSSSVQGEIPFTHRAKKVLSDLVADESRLLGHRHIGSEHILLALIREGEGLAAVLLDKFAVGLEGARQAVRAVTHGTAPAPTPMLGTEVPAGAGLVSRLLKRAAEEARELGVGEISHQHLLMAILADPGAADLSDMLQVRGITLEWLRDQYRDH